MLDRENTETYYAVDHHGMMVADGKKGDSILSTFEAWYAYSDESFLDAIADCFVIGSRKATGYRHPSMKHLPAGNISRDHYIMALIAFYLIPGSRWYFRMEQIIRMSGWRLARWHFKTPDLRIWELSLISGNHWKWHLIAIPFYLVAMCWNKLLQVLGGFYEVRNEDYIFTRPNWWQRFLRGLRFPSYAHYIASWQNYVLPASLGRSLLQKILRIDTGKWNPATRLLNGLPVTFFYPPMKAGRLNTRTDRTNDRPGLEMDLEWTGFNKIDQDLVAVLFQEA